jgi:peptidyl-prolyl cis-trans isomerase C
LAAEARRRGLEKDPQTAERIRQVLRDEVLQRLRAQVSGPDEIPEGEVRAYYDQHREQFREPERRRVAHIALGSEAQASEILEQAQAATPAEWGELVQKHSLDKSAKLAPAGPQELAGDLGIVQLGPPSAGDKSLVPDALREAVFKIEKVGGVYGEVVKAGGRFHIVRLAGKTEARTRSFADAQRSIRVKLVRERIRAAEQKLEKELRQRFTVKIDEDALAKVSVPGMEKSGAPAGREPGQ